MSEATGTSTSGGPTVIDVTPTPGTEPARSADERPKSRRGAAAISALAALVLALATAPYWAPPVASVLPWGAAPEPKPVPADMRPLEAKLGALEVKVGELAQAQQRLAVLDQRVAQLEQRPAPAPNPRDVQQAAQQAQALGALGDRLAALEQRIATLAAAASSQTAADATKGLQGQIQALTQKLDDQSQLLAKLQSREAGGAGDRTAAALIVTVGQLRSALATSRPYAAELQSVEALAKDQPDVLTPLRTLDTRAETGIPIVEELRHRFNAVADEVDRVASPPAEAGWRGRVIGWTQRFFHVRRAGGESSQPDDAIAAAETALGAGDLAGAVTAVRRLQGPAAEPAKSWLDDAQARLDADKTLVAVTGALTRGLLAAPAEAKP